MKQKAIYSLVSAIFLQSPLILFAEENRLQLDSVVVIGKKEFNLDKDLAGSVDVITRDELEYEHVTDTLELFTKTPGVVLSRFNQGIINTDISIRGFAGDGTTPHAKLLVDGIPSNLHNGYNEMDYLFPTNIQSIQVFKGTSDPSTGLFATAGNYKVETRKDTGKVLEATFGSFDTKELQGYFGDKTGKFTQNYAFGYRDAGGYRDRTDIEKIALSGRWQYDFEKSSLALSTKYGKYNAFESPGYLTKQQARDNPRSSAPFASEDGGNKETKQVSLHYDYFFNDDLDLSLKAYWQNFERQRWVRFTQAGSLQERVDDQDMLGFIAKVNWQINPQWRAESGFDMENQDIIEQRFGTLGQRRVRNPASVIRNFDHEFDTKGAYLQIENKPVDYFTWNAAVRADRIDGDFTAFNAAGVASPRKIYDFGTIIQPKLNAFLSVTDNHTVFANYGRSFQHPFGGDAYTAGNTSARDVALNDGWELGLKSTWGKLNTRVSYWEQKAEDEFVVIDGTSQNVGETKRDGVDVSFDVSLTEQWSIWGNASKVFTEITKTSTANQGFTGNDLRGIPDHTASLGISFQYNPEFIARMHIDRQGAYYINEANLGGKFGDYTLVNASADYKTNWGKVSLQANNIFDKFYEYVFDFGNAGTDTIHSPGAGRNFMLSATLDF